MMPFQASSIYIHGKLIKNLLIFTKQDGDAFAFVLHISYTYYPHWKCMKVLEHPKPQA
jgi:hypothetical protein